MSLLREKRNTFFIIFYGNHTARRWICDYPVMVVWPSHNWVSSGLKTRWKGLTKSRCVRVEYEIRFFQLQELRWVLYTPIYCVPPICCISGHQEGTRKSTRKSWKKNEGSSQIPSAAILRDQKRLTLRSVNTELIYTHTYVYITINCSVLH
jgi:hypothetical protein